MPRLVLYKARQNPASVEQDIDESGRARSRRRALRSHPSQLGSFEEALLLRPSSVVSAYFGSSLRAMIVQFSGSFAAGEALRRQCLRLRVV